MRLVLDSKMSFRFIVVGLVDIKIGDTVRWNGSFFW